MASQDWFEKDFYAILGVPHDADDNAIKKKYRKVARDLHPDHNVGDTQAEERFKEVGEAYAVLSDPEQRREYDAIRAMSHGGARFAPGGGGGFEDIFANFGAGGPAGGRVRFGPGGSGAGEAGPNIEDLLGQMFGGASGFPGGAGAGRGAGPAGYGGFGAPAGPRAGADVQATTRIGFREAVEGSTVTLTSPDLGRVTVRVPAGVKDGQRIKLRGKGRAGDPGAPAGDLILTVSVDSHPVFGREGDNLTVDLPVTFAEAALGATVPVPVLDGGSVKVRVAPGTPSGRVLRLKGRGVKRGDKAGDLMARVQVVVPQRLTDEARSAIEAMAAAEDGYDPRAELFERAQD